MPGSGSADIAFAKTGSFLGSAIDEDGDGNVDYWEPGKNPVVQDLTLERALSRLRKPASVWSSESIAGNLEGAFGVQFTMDDVNQTDVHDIVFNGTSPVTLVPGEAASSRWFVGLDYLSGTAERELLGCVPLDFRVEYTQGGAVRITLTMAYADEQRNTSFTPSSVNEATGATGQFHGVDISVNATTQVKEQSATLQISNITQFQRGSQKLPVDAVVGAAEASFELTAIYSETDQLELAYGGAGQSTTSATMDDVSGSMALSAGGAQVADYQLAKLKPDNYSWEELFSGENTTETTSFNVDGDPAVTVA